LAKTSSARTDSNPADTSAADTDAFVPSDVDRSGSSDAGDTEWILSCVEGPAGCACPGDPNMNGDPAVDADDLTQLVWSVLSLDG
jgi:hypothetical protein